MYSDYASSNPTTCTGTPATATTGNNGNTMGYWYQDNTASPVPSHTATYTYDPLNRLQTAVAKTLVPATIWSQTYSEDRWGNGSCSGSGLCGSMSYSSSNNNQLASVGGVTVSYDAAGNLLTDPNTLPVSNYTWDAEGRLTAITQGGNPFLTHVYNAHGQVVSTTYQAYGNFKVDGVFDPSGRELGYYDGTSGGWWDRDVWVAGRMMAQSYPSATYFLHANSLHSDTQVSNQAGAVMQDMLYYPWGQLWTHTGYMNDAHFAGFQQSINNLDNTPTRTYSNPQGRWLTPDPENAGADPSDPQTWNLYAYVRNNPTTLTDPTGEDYHACVDNGNGGQNCFTDPSDYNFQQAVQQSGATLQNGQILVDVNGQQVQIGTYQHFVGPGEEGGGLPDQTVNLLGVAGLAEAGAKGFVALGEGAVSGIGRLLGVGAAKTIPGVAGSGAKATVEDILQGAVDEGGSRAQVLSKSGGITQAQRDFDALAGREEIRGPVKIKELPDGRRAVLRTDPSTLSGGRPSLDIQPAGGGYAEVKIRY